MNLRTLQENVAEATQALDNVAQFIEDRTGDDSVQEKVRPIHYGDILRRIELSGGTISVAQIVVYKGQNDENTPDAPVGGIVNLLTGQIEAPDGWQLAPPTNFGKVWASSSFWNDGVNQTGWCAPYLIKGFDGKDGEQGPQGEQGPMGLQGPKGDPGEIGPAGPAGPAGPQGRAGIDGRDGTDGKDGADGADGMDGSAYEYVYFRGLTLDDKPANIPSGEGKNQDDYEPTYTKTVTVNGNSVILKWTDKAQGVDETYKFEWRSERKKSDANTWGDFTAPILWAKYGEKGKDGDGVQYIFAVTEKNSAPDNPTPTDWETNSEYQNNEAEEYIPSGWSDDPIEVDSTNKYCWTSVRKYRNGKWGRYSEPTLWTKWVESSGAVTADVIVIDMDPDFAMVNSDDNSAETTIQAFRGDDPIIIQDVTCDSGDYKCTITPSNGNKTWKVIVSEIKDSVSVKVNIKLSDTSTRTKTFSIYHTKNDSETVSVDFGDDNILVPCSDGSNPDAGFFNNLEIPVMMRVAGQLVKATSITPDKNPESFEMTSDGNIKVKSFPGSAQKTSVKFTVSDGTNTAEGYVNFTKFNTAGGTIAMYTLNVAANDIICDTRGDSNKYEVYTGATAVKDNIIKVSVNHYSSDSGNNVMSVSELPSIYAVFYANDPQDWAENANSTLGEYHKITDAGIKIGRDINPDKCVSFQLREWVGNGTPWSNMADGNYIVWDTENILVDIIRDIASYQFVVTPNKIHRNVNGEIIVPENREITIGLSKNKAGDGETKYESLSVIPVGYDIYYEKDNNGNPEKFGEEHENNTLPVKIDVSDVTNSIVLTLVVNENSEDDGQVVLSETIEITSDVPGKSAYIGYLTDPMCTVSCDANGIPTDGQVYDTTFKVTNGTVTNVTIPGGKGYTAKFENGKVYFERFTQDLPEVTNITLTATCKYSDGTIGEEEAGYTIVKLKVADASTILDFSNDNIVIPCDENGTPYTSNVSTYVAMLHGDDVLTLTSDNVVLGSRDEEGYYKITLSIQDLVFDGDVCNKELTFTGTDGSESWTRKGQLILTKLKAGESGKIWDLVLTTDSPKYDNTTDKFDDDYIEGWVNIWGADSWEVASHDVLTTAGRYIVYKTDESTSTYTPMKSTDFVDNHFRLYINPVTGNKAYVDLDRSSGVKIALAKLEEGQYIPIQEEIMRASFDGRDFGKFELMLSDEIISRHTDGDGNVTVTPTVIKVNGIYEYSGMVREQYKGGKTHNQHISGLDIYYGIDDAYNGETTVQNWMTELPDTGNDGYASNDTINVVNATSHVNVYLVAHYKEGNNPEELRIIDNKLIRVIPTADGTKGDKGDKGDTGTFSEAERNALLSEAQDNINAAKSELTDELSAAQSALEKAIADEKAARESGDTEALEKAQSALAAAAANLATINEVQGALGTLSDLFEETSNGDLKLKEGALNEADVYSLSLAALGKDAEGVEGFNPETDLAADNIFTRAINSVLGRFVKIKAEHVDASTLEGITVKAKSGNWELNNDGSATLGSGGIEISSTGSVTFGPNVKLKWSDITDAPEIGGEESDVTAITVNVEDFSETGSYKWVGSVTYNGESMYLWVYEDHMSDYKNNEHLNSTIQAAFTYKKNDSISIGDSCYAGWAYYSDDNGEWSDEEMDETTVKSVVGGSSNLTADDVTDIIKTTYIDGSMISTNTINGNSIKANSIDASKLKVDTIDARNVNTIPEGNGSITITGNDMVVRNSASTDSVMKISGDYITPINNLPAKQTHRIQIQRASYDRLGSSDICLYVKAYSGINLTNSSYTVSHNMNYKLPKLTYNFTPYDVNTLTNIRPATVQVSADICFVDAGDEPSYMDGGGIYYHIDLVGDNDDSSAAIDFRNPWSGQSGTIEATSHASNWVYYYDTPLNTLNAGRYDVYVRYNIYGISSINGYIEINEMYFDSSAYDFTFTPTTSVNNFTEIGRDGIRVMKNTENYFYTDGDNYIVRNNKYAFGQNATEGFWISLPSTYTNWDGTSWYKYSGLQMTGSGSSFTMVFTKRESIANVV